MKQQVIRHPEYNSKTVVNDIAIIKTATPISFNKFRHSVCLPTKSMPLKFGEMLRVSGFGTTEPIAIPTIEPYDSRLTVKLAGKFPDLKLVDLPYLPDQECSSSYGRIGTNTFRKIISWKKLGCK